ncbi:MAG: DUF2569 family protein [Ignavibacteriales bacterium]|nr:DUF2569 family protein [Ignavibacteriales bacterium]
MTDINENLENEKSTIPPVPPLPPLKGIGGWLLLFIIGTFVSAVINFITVAQTGSTSFLSGGNMLVSNPYVASLLGLFALITAIMLITVRNIYAVWAARIYMITYLIGSIIVAITGLEAPSGYYVINEEGEIIRGIFSAILLNSIWQTYFFRSKRVQATYPKIAEVQVDSSLEIGKTLTSLFNKQKLGINYYVGLGLFLTLVISWFLYGIYYALWEGYTLQFPTASFFFAFRIPLAILYSVLLIFLLHTLRNDWLVAVAMGFGTSILSLLFRLILSNTSAGLLFNFTWSFFLVLSLSLAMRTWGFKWWAFILWVPIGNLVDGLIGEILNILQYSGNHFSISFLPISIIQGMVEGTIFYFSIYFFLKQKGVPVNKVG